MKQLAMFLALIAPVASLFFAFAGVLLLRAHYWTGGAASLLIAMVALIADLRYVDNSAFASRPDGRPRMISISAALWVTVIVLNGVATFHVLDARASGVTDRLAAIAWLCSVAIGLLTVWFRHGGTMVCRSFARSIRAHRGELALLVGIVIVAAALRTTGLSMHPYPWSGDEASVAREASRIVSGDTTDFFRTGWSDQPYWSFVPTAATQFLFGGGMTSIRLTSALTGTLAVVAVFLVTRELFDATIAMLAAAFLATLPYHVHFSRLGFQNIVDSLMSSAVLWLVIRAVKTNDARYFYTAGAAAGLTIYSYAGTRLVLVLAIGTLAYCLYQQRPADRRGKHLLIFVGGAVVSAAPQAVFFVMNPGRFLSRLGQESILLNGWLTSHAAATGVSPAQVLFDQFSGTVLTFVAQPASGHLFNSPSPYLTLPESILFLVGMATAIAWISTPRYFIILAWFWTVVVAGGMLTLNPPANTRLLMTTPAVAVLMAVGLRTAFTQIERRKLIVERLFVPVCVVIVSAIAFQNIRFYLVEYRRQMYFQDTNAEFAMEVGLMARSFGDDCSLYLLGAPHVFASFPTFRYLAPRSVIIDLAAADADGLSRPAHTPAAFFAIAENRSLLADLKRKIPGGSGGIFYRKSRPGEILFEYYLVTQ
jgi:4-amino-4-deoxy-L-arabinose transferase-like glycosyltransferase